VRAQRRVEVMHQARFFESYRPLSCSRSTRLRAAALGVLHALFGQVHLLLLFVDPVVARTVFVGLPDHPRHDLVDRQIQLR
jgi:hypothetical protein